VVNVQPCAVEGRCATRIAEPPQTAGVGSEQTGGTQEQGRLATSAWAHDSHGFARAHHQVDVGDRPRVRQARAGAGDEPFREASDFQGDAHAD
jgi:hypothetical protein